MSFGNSSTKKAFPEARKTKQMIMSSRNDARDAISRARKEKSLKAFEDMEDAVRQFFYDIQPYLQDLPDNGDEYEIDIADLQFPEMKDRRYKDITQKDFKYWVKAWMEMNKMIRDLGITDIGVSRDTHDFGQALVNQLGIDVPYKRDNFYLDVNDADLGWIRWSIEMQNIRKALRQDRDVVVFVFGPNRMGKSTFCMQTARIVENGKNSGTLPDKAFVFDDDDFWEASERPPYSSKILDEFSRLLYSKDANKGGQVSRKKRFKTDAKNNQFTIGADTQYFALDKEFKKDKVDFAVRIPERGKFEVYGEKEMKKIDKEGDDIDLPDPLFTGKFPDMNPSDGETDPLWEKYLEMEDQKVQKKDEDKDGTNLTEAQIDKAVEEVKEREEYFKKEYNKRVFIDADRISTGIECVDGMIPDRTADKIKSKAEAELGLPKKVES